jgi:hypothetical protein
MLLDLAKLHFYVGTPENVAKCETLLQRLLQRLFFLEDSTSPADMAQLAKVYRDAETRLYLPSGATDTEPASITELRAIRREAAAVLGNVKSERDCYGHHRKDVPRGFYEFYKKKTDDILRDYVGPAEEAYHVYANAAETQAVKKEVIRTNIEPCPISHGTKQGLD